MLTPGEKIFPLKKIQVVPQILFFQRICPDPVIPVFLPQVDEIEKIRHSPFGFCYQYGLSLEGDGSVACESAWLDGVVEKMSVASCKLTGDAGRDRGDGIDSFRNEMVMGEGCLQ